ncbi:MAG: phytanoyl-CoA dioxygenase family protein [bacterium]|nr:phytanoyl-CoA dioxygenase family protein [bacterium]
MNWEPQSEPLKKSFDRDGFVVLPGFLTPQEAGELSSKVRDYIQNTLPDLPENAAFYEEKGNSETLMRLEGMHQHDAYFHGLLLSDAFAGLASMLLKDDIVPRNIELFNKPPLVGKLTPPHQDGFYFMLEPNEAITLWLALDEVNTQNGCLFYVPGSHQNGMRPHRLSNVLGFSQGITDYGDNDRNIERAIPVSPGDLIAHHSMVIHRADPNPGTRHRRALGFVYYAKRAKQDAEKQKAYREELMQRWKEQGKL